MVKESGVTIISLVVSIIVLIILASVSIKLSLRDNAGSGGVLDKTINSTTQHQEMANKETIKMNDALANELEDWGF